METKFYQLRLFKKGLIEIFQNVFDHTVYVKKDCIVVKYSSTQNEGSFTVSTRKFNELYNIEEIENPIYELNGSIPQNIEVKFHGNGKLQEDRK